MDFTDSELASNPANSLIMQGFQKDGTELTTTTNVDNSGEDLKKKAIEATLAKMKSAKPSKAQVNK